MTFDEYLNKPDPMAGFCIADNWSPEEQAAARQAWAACEAQLDAAQTEAYAEGRKDEAEDFECCGNPVVGAQYMGQSEMVCCGNPEPKGGVPSRLEQLISKASWASSSDRAEAMRLAAQQSAPQAEVPKGARERVLAFITEYAKRRGLHPELLYTLGTSEDGLELTVSDLRALCTLAAPTSPTPAEAKPAGQGEAIEQAISTLQAAQNGLNWYRDMHPEHESQSDQEMDADIEAAIEGLRGATPLPAQVQPAAKVGMVPPVLSVLADWEEENGTLAAILPDEWLALHERITSAAILQSPRQALFALAQAAPQQPVSAEARVSKAEFYKVVRAAMREYRERNPPRYLNDDQASADDSEFVGELADCHAALSPQQAEPGKGAT